MTNKTFTVSASTDSLRRDATFLIRKANEFPCHVTLGRDGIQVNAKSLLGVLSMDLSQGDELNLCADGEQEEACIAALQALLCV